MKVQKKLAQVGPKRLLALDGGGVRSIISLEILLELERTLQQATGATDAFTLADYYDYIAGTGSGALIAACLSMGMRVETIRIQFIPVAAEAFTPTDSIYPSRSRQRDEKLNALLQDLFGTDTLLGSDKLKTLLLLILKSAVSDAPRLLTNNPNSFYNQPEHSTFNLAMPLWQLIKASLTTPVFTTPEYIHIPESTPSYVSGSVSIYNNPAFILFLQATAPAYRLNWPSGEDKLLLTSIGTGRNPGVNVNLGPNEENPLFQTGAISAGLLQSASFEQDFLCRFFGRCRVGDVLTEEIGSMVDQETSLFEKLFTYLRYDVELSNPSLLTLGLSSIPAESVSGLDAIGSLDSLQIIGRTVAQKTVNAVHFLKQTSKTEERKTLPDKPETYELNTSNIKEMVSRDSSLDFSKKAIQEIMSDEDTIRIAQDYRYRGKDSWNWWVWIEGPENELDLIKYVTYYLHASFPDPVREIKDRKSKFRLETSGWGVFLIHATVTLKKGDEKKLTHYLKLGYPDGSFTTN